MKNSKKKTTNAIRLLQGGKVDFEVVEYETDGEIGDNFGMRVAEITGIPAEMSFKTLVAKGDKNGYLTACVSVNSEVDLKKLAAVSGNKKVDLIPTKELLGLTGYIRGGVSPVGMKKTFPTYIDKSAENNDKIAVSGGMCGLTVIMSPQALKDFISAEFADIAK